MVNSYYGIYQAEPGQTAPDAGMRSGPSPLTGLRLDLPCTEDPELFFAESPQDVEQAKVMCRGCQARLACLAGALERREPWGVWGGELLLRGAIVPRKRPRGRPRKDVVAIGLLPGPGAAAWSRSFRRVAGPVAPLHGSAKSGCIPGRRRVIVTAC